MMIADDLICGHSLICREDFERKCSRIDDFTVKENFFLKESTAVFDSTRESLVPRICCHRTDVFSDKWTQGLEREIDIFPGLGLFNMDESLDMEEHAGIQKVLKESDFLNCEVSKGSGEGSVTSDNDDGYEELTSPGDLLIPMWSEIDTEHPEYMMEVEVISSWANENDVEDQQIREEYILTEESCPSPGSTGEYSDYGSESGNEAVTHLGESILSSLPPVKADYSRENFIPLIPVKVDRTFDYPDTVQTELVNVNVKSEFVPVPENHTSCLDTNTLSCQGIPPQNCINIPKLELTDDSESEKSYSNDGDSEGSNSGKSERKRPGRKKGQVSRVYHLWEFIRDLLNDPQCCPSLIRWENEAEGIFRVVRSEDVAKLWGQKKKNRTAMTYEKMSRSIRYSRKEGYFADLPKDKGYPKKLCFKFGEKSSGWNTTLKTSKAALLI